MTTEWLNVEGVDGIDCDDVYGDIGQVGWGDADMARAGQWESEAMNMEMNLMPRHDFKWCQQIQTKPNQMWPINDYGYEFDALPWFQIHYVTTTMSQLQLKSISKVQK